MPKFELYSIEDFDLKNQRVLIRTDFNVPIQNGQVPASHIRLRSSLKTIRYALEQKAKVIIASHRGRPARRSLEQDKKLFTLEPFGYYLGQVLKCEVIFIEDTHTPPPDILINSLNAEKIILLENLRFHPDEEAGSRDWAKQTASYVDIYINEAFSVSHRSHASVCALAECTPQRGQGLSLKKEKEMLDYLRGPAPPPFALITGGGFTKLSSKLKTISRLIDRVDIFLIGGAMACAFLKAMGKQIGLAAVPAEAVNAAVDLINRIKEKNKTLVLPVDHIVCEGSFKAGSARAKNTPGPRVPPGCCPVDIGEKTRRLFADKLKPARTIFWNGPVGRYEEPAYAEGTKSLCRSVGACEGAFRAAGGGDSTAVIFRFQLEENFNYISTGGGAALKYLETGRLPGLESLMTPVKS